MVISSSFTPPSLSLSLFIFLPHSGSVKCGVNCSVSSPSQEPVLFWWCKGLIPDFFFVSFSCPWTGKPVWGESGELVCLKPIPCQPTHFWNDENGSKYQKAYFSSYPGWYTNGTHTMYNITYSQVSI